MMSKLDKLSQVAIWILLLISLAVFTLPYLFMISNSFEKFSYSLPYPPRIFPKEIKLDAYIYILTKKNFLPAFKNSVLVTLSATSIALFIASLSAYGFSKIKFIGRKILFKIYVFTLMMPAFLSIIPQYILLYNIKFPGSSNSLTGTRIGLIIIYVSTIIAGSTFFLKTFFDSLPKDIEESVFIDGGSNWTIYFKIVLPLSSPAIGTNFIMNLQYIWEEFFTAKIILGAKSEALLTLPVILQRLNGEHVTRWEWVFAASILIQVPIILLFVIFQKKFVVGGLTEGSIK